MMKTLLSKTLLVLTVPTVAAGQGHGPVYGLSTPTLGQGAWSVDIATMGIVSDDGGTWMIRPMVSYGFTQDLQASVSIPLRLGPQLGNPPVRGLTRMPSTQDIEVTLGWRFHRNGTAVGARFESTAYVSVDVPVDNVRAGVEPSTRLTTALVTGYASRTVYLWVGGLYGRSVVANDADYRFGQTVMYSIVVGYRPTFFRRDYPAPDWRVLVEVVGEWTDRDRLQGNTVANTGGHRLLLAPTVLGLYGRWGVAGGPAFPIVERLNGVQIGDRFRWVLNLIVWF